MSILGVRLMYISKPAPDGGSQNGKVLIGWIVMGLESVPRVPACYEINCSRLSIFNNNKTIYFLSAIALHRCHIERGDVSKDRRLDCLLNHFFSGADQRKHQSSASLAFVGRIHRLPWIPFTKASDGEDVFILWRYHAIFGQFTSTVFQCNACCFE